MLELSVGKLLLLALIALLVLGPEKLPGAARTAGALLRRLRRSWDGVRAEVERELEIEEIKRTAREAAAQAEAAQAEVKAAQAQVRSDVEGVQQATRRSLAEVTALPAAVAMPPAGDASGDTAPDRHTGGDDVARGPP